MTETKENFDELFRKLPEDLQSAIVSVDSFEKIQALGKKYKLHIDKVALLGDETGLVMFGITHPKDFMDNLKRRLEMPEETARELVADINEQIFGPIRGSMKKMSDEQKETNNKQQITNNGNRDQGKQDISYVLQDTRLTEADEKILAESGIEITNNNKQITNNETQENQLQKDELIEGLENPSDIKQNGAGMPAGFALVKSTPMDLSTIVSPEQKLETAVRMPMAQSTYQGKSLPQKPTEAEQKKYTDDPYREPIN